MSRKLCFAGHRSRVMKVDQYHDGTFFPSQSCSSQVTTLLTSVDLLRLDSQCSRCTRWCIVMPWVLQKSSPTNIFRWGTDLISLLILFLFLFFFRLLPGAPKSKAQDSVVSNRIWMKFGRNGHHTTIRIDWWSQIFDLKSYFQDGGHDVISHRKVLPPGERTRRVCPTPMQQRTPVPDL